MEENTGREKTHGNKFLVMALTTNNQTKMHRQINVRININQ